MYISYIICIYILYFLYKPKTPSQIPEHGRPIRGSTDQEAAQNSPELPLYILLHVHP